jgi:hypothetical protein
VIDDVPQGSWKSITFVAALRHDKMVAPMVFDGPMTGEMFLAYVEHCLVPTLKRKRCPDPTFWEASASSMMPTHEQASF